MFLNVAFRGKRIYLSMLKMDIVIHYIQEFTYIGMFIFLIWCGIGFPLPEDVIIIAAGFLVYEEVTNLYFTIVVCLVGVMIGDLIIYYLGKKFGLDVMNHRRFRRILTEKRLVRIEKLFNRYGNSIVFFTRFFAFVRAPLFLSAGALGVRLTTFLFYDFLAALVSVPLMVMIGFYFGEEIEVGVQHVRQAEYLITAGALIFILYVIIRWRRSRQERLETLKARKAQQLGNEPKILEDTSRLL